MHGRDYSDTRLRLASTQLSELLNHTTCYYSLSVSP